MAEHTWTEGDEKQARDLARASRDLTEGFYINRLARRYLDISGRPISPPSPAETPQTTPAVRDKVCRHGYLGGCPVCDLPPAPPTETQTATPDDESLDFIFGGTDRIREAQSGPPRAAQPATTEMVESIIALLVGGPTVEASSKPLALRITQAIPLIRRLASTPSPTTPEAPEPR